MRERIVELLENAPYGTRKYGECFFHNTIERIADYLIANGVIVQKQGEWEEKEHGEFYSCSCCNYTTDFRLTNYCPNCGAEMRR